MRKNNIGVILDKALCSGCGACTVICKKDCVSMKEDAGYNYPCIDTASCNNCGLCLKVCPGRRILDRLSAGGLTPLELRDSAINYTACSADEDIRYNAASGGVISGISIFLLERGYIDGLICVKQDEDNPLLNIAFAAFNRQEVLQASGSRYSPVSACTALKEILHDGKRYAFIGKPCEIDALNELQKYIPELEKKIRLKISLMCACTPSRKGTLKLLKDLNIKPSEVRKLSYRGNGWLGFFSVETKDGLRYSMPYFQAWNKYLSRFPCLRCAICDDPLGESSDITVGDAWDRKLLENNSGLSAVIVRTDTGRKYMELALDNNIIKADIVDTDDILRFQRSLVKKVEKAANNVFAYSMVFLNKYRFGEIRAAYGSNFHNYFSLLKRTARFLIYKISNKFNYEKVIANG